MAASSRMRPTLAPLKLQTGTEQQQPYAHVKNAEVSRNGDPASLFEGAQPQQHGVCLRVPERADADALGS